jgi:hypothetical protein
MRQCQGNSLFLLPTTQKLHNTIEKASKDTQTLYTTKSLKEARKNIIVSVDRILQHDLVRENQLATEFVSTMEREMHTIKERFNTQMMSILGSKNGQDNELCYPSFKNKNRRLLRRDSRDTEDRIKSCYNWEIPCLHQIDRSSLEMKLVHELINEFIYNPFLINEFILLMNH